MPPCRTLLLIKKGSETTFCHPRQLLSYYFFIIFLFTVTIIYFYLFSALFTNKNTFNALIWHCWLGDRKGIQPVKKNCVGLLVVMIWLELCTACSSNCHHHLHHPLLQYTPANPGSPRKWPLKWRERERERERAPRMGVAGWMGGTKDLCPKLQNPHAATESCLQTITHL